MSPAAIFLRERCNHWGSKATLGEKDVQVRLLSEIGNAGKKRAAQVGYMGAEIRGRSFGRRQQGALIRQNIILGGKLGLDRQIFTEAELGPMRERLINCT